MAELKAKTRNGIMVHGRPRVFFCAHPQDHARYFDAVSDRILKYQNCAVWYWQDPLEEVNAEELSLLLCEMQLFVVPVTAAFLHTANNGRCRDLPFALEHHIPVLPLAMEPQLAEEFDEICGNLQFLDLTVRDATAISVEEKIDTFLRSVLVGDDLANNVRASFDGYAFLSYCKTDRRYAQQLMNKIHENERCRDVAIWYDEFLVPGEDFNDAIAQALHKSDLFALVVTPNLIKGSNYVKKYEYPAALRSGKPILAAELVETNRNILEKEFQSIPPCTDVRDREAFDESLMNAVSALSLRQNDHDPMHLYYIGLAYLAGIDVEKNPTRGVSLLERAAKAGVPDAMQKLIAVYEYGDGAPRDWERSLMWRERLADEYQARYEETKSEEDGLKLQKTLREWGQALARDYDRQKAIKVIRRLVETAQNIRVTSATHESDRAVVLSQLELCDLLLREGEADAAKALIETTGKAAVELVNEENGTVTWWDYLVFAICHTVRARVLETMRDLKGSDLFFTAATELCENAYKESRTPQFLYQLGETSMFYGMMLTNAKKDNAKAIDVLFRAVQLLEDAKEDFEDPLAKTNLAAAYLMLAQCETEEQRHTQAAAYARTVIRYLHEMMDRSPTVTVRRFLGEAYRLMGDNPTVESGERARYRHAAETFLTNAAESAPTIDNLVAIAVKPFEQALQAIEDDNAEKAKICFQKVVDLLAGASVEQAVHYRATVPIASACAFLAMILSEEEEQPQEALRMLKKALPFVEKVLEKEYQMEREEWYWCSMVLLQFGKVYKELGEWERAESFAERADLLCGRWFCDGEKEPRERELSMETYQLLGELAREHGKRKDAIGYFKQFLRLAEEQTERDPSMENRVEVGVAYAKLAEVYGETEDYETALSYAERALELFKEAYKDRREPFLKDNVDIMKDMIRTCKRKIGKRFLWF